MTSKHRMNPCRLGRFAVPALALAPALLLSGCANLVHHSEPFTLDVPWQDYERVEVHTRNGGVELVQAAGHPLSIEGKKQAGGSTSDEARSNAALVHISATPDPNDERVLRIEAEFPEALRHKSPGASFRIRVPAAVTARVKTSNGAVTARGLRGPSTLETANGAIEAAEIAGDLDVRTSNGRITLKSISGAVVAVSSNGTIEASGLAGSAALRTTNGGIKVEDAVGNVDATTSNGGVRVSAHPPEDGHVEVHTSNGSVHLNLPKEVQANVDLSTSNGRVETDADGVSFADIRTSRAQFAAKMNGGGRGRVRAQTSNGSIKLECK